MFKMLSQLWAALSGLFNSLEGATIALDNLVDETLSSSEASLAEKLKDNEERVKATGLSHEQIAEARTRLRKRVH